MDGAARSRAASRTAPARERACDAAASRVCRAERAARPQNRPHMAPMRAVARDDSPPAQPADSRRLFSNLSCERSSGALRHDPGSVAGAALLVSGTAVGAGILALPEVTQGAGFVPSATALTAAAAFSAATGLLLAEVCLQRMRSAGAGGVSLLSMARGTLGSAGASAAGLAYLFLHYALLVAYIAKAGELLAAAAPPALAAIAASAGATAALPGAAGIVFAAALALLCAAASQRTLDTVNGALVVGVVATFVGLLGVAAGGVSAGALQVGDWAAVPAALPVVALAFVFHNVVPVVCTALEGDAARVRTALLVGLAVPWVMFIAWEGAILGSLPPPQHQHQQRQLLQQPASRAAAWQAEREGGAAAAPHLLEGGMLEQAPGRGPPRGADPLSALAARSGAVQPLVRGFSLLAIATSYIGFVLGLTDFLADVLRSPSRRGAALYALALGPPLGVALANPGVFLQALDAAGTYGVLTLFGLLPPAMAWRTRYGGGAAAGGAGTDALLPGGRPVLLIVGATAGAVIANELAQLLHVPG